MPFEIVRNDLTNMQVDAIVNAANHRPVIGYGVDSGIHAKAGPRLLRARRAIGEIPYGEAALTPGYDLAAKYVIHAASPVWQGGGKGEADQLERCYTRALALALDHGCESVAFPLLSAGNHGFPGDLALQTAIHAISSFLLHHEMQIYLVVFDRSLFTLSEKLFRSVQSYIDDRYTEEKLLEEYDGRDAKGIRASMGRRLRLARESRREICEDLATNEELYAPCAPAAPRPRSLEDLMGQVEETFSESLLELIDRKGLKDPEVYKKANVDRKLFSKIKNNREYRPSKTTAVAFAIALELDLEETRAFIGRAGYAMTRSSKFDIIIEYFLEKGNYDIFEINEVLFYYEQPLIGA